MIQSDEIMMTMPNFVFCEGFANHIPKEYRDDLSDVNWAETAFATTNICRDTILTEYDITEDGCIYERDTDNGEIERLEFTGELELAGAVLTDEFDYEVEARALFFKGDLKEFDFLRAKKIDNTRRIAASKEMMTSIKKEASKRVSAWYRIVSFILGGVRSVFGFLIKLCWFIQYKIT